MNFTTLQMKSWQGQHGNKWVKEGNLRHLEKTYRGWIGRTRSKLNEDYIGHLNRSSRILEVGCNIGNQLDILRKMGFDNLYGVEINHMAIKIAQERFAKNRIFEGSAFEIPFEDNYFDLVYTSGVLIHINPKDLEKASKEIYRCTNKNIWGFEYYHEENCPVHYKKFPNGYLWYNNFAKVYMENTGARVIKEEIFTISKPYKHVYLLEK